MLRHNPQLPEPLILDFDQQEKLDTAQENIADQNRVYRFHACLKTQRPQQTLSPETLKTISSFLVTRKIHTE